jgi:hypothetical protein
MRNVKNLSNFPAVTLVYYKTPLKFILSSKSGVPTLKTYRLASHK